MSYSGNCRLGDLFSSRREKGRAGSPTFPVTLNPVAEFTKRGRIVAQHAT